MVSYQGEKMSKSLGNLVFVSRLLADGVDPMAIRMALLAHHYRSDWEWTDAVLATAQARLARWRAALARAEAAVPTRTPAAPTAVEAIRSAEAEYGAPASPQPDRRVLAGVRARLRDDLDAPGALTIVDRWADRCWPRRRPDHPRRRRRGPAWSGTTVDALLGISL